MNFETFNFHPAIKDGINVMGYVTPTPIQVKAIPPILRGGPDWAGPDWYRQDSCFRVANLAVSADKSVGSGWCPHNITHA